MDPGTTHNAMLTTKTVHTIVIVLVLVTPTANIDLPPPPFFGRRTMSKVKAPKTPKAKGIPNRHLHARTTFLYQAAAYLTLQSARVNLETPASLDLAASSAPSHSPVALQLGADLQQVSRKAQLRLAVDLKRSMCKSCNTILIPGQTATQTMQNHSRGGKKPWADVLVVQCRFCSSRKRFPVGSAQQLNKSKRGAASVVGNVDAPSSNDVSMSDAAPVIGNEHTPLTD